MRTFLLTALFFSLSPLVSADTVIDYTLTAGSDTITFSLPEFPTSPGCNFIGGCLSLSAAITDNGNTFDGSVALYPGGLAILEPNPMPGYNPYLLLYNLTPANKSLIAGRLVQAALLTFTDLQLTSTTSAGTPIDNEDFVLNAVAVVVPEPGSLVLGAVGFALLVPRRRQFHILSESRSAKPVIS